jgi:monoamine oxidase
MAGARAEEREDCEPSRWLSEALRTLGRLLRITADDLARELEAWHTYNWRDDPFARGAYSYPRAGGLEAQRRLGEPVEETLYFAGEATNSEGHAGTVHGAIATGLRAARQILEPS